MRRRCMAFKGVVTGAVLSRKDHASSLMTIVPSLELAMSRAALLDLLSQNSRKTDVSDWLHAEGLPVYRSSRIGCG